MPSFQLRRARTRRESARERDEAYRLLRTNVEIALTDLEHPSLLVTSPRAGEGKSQTTAELARSFAMAGRRVIAVDLDLRSPSMHLGFGEAVEPGVSDVLRDRCALADAIRSVSVRGAAGNSTLYLLPAGSGVANPPELLGTQRTVRLIETLAAQADIVIVDTPPVLPVADTLIVARIVSGVLLVVNSGTTSYSATMRAKDALVRSHARLLGLVLNRFDERGAEMQLGYGSDYAATRTGDTDSIVDGGTSRGNGVHR